MAVAKCLRDTCGVEFEDIEPQCEKTVTAVGEELATVEEVGDAEPEVKAEGGLEECAPL